MGPNRQGRQLVFKNRRDGYLSKVQKARNKWVVVDLDTHFSNIESIKKARIEVESLRFAAKLLLNQRSCEISVWKSSQKSPLPSLQMLYSTYVIYKIFQVIAFLVAGRDLAVADCGDLSIFW